MKNAKEGKIMAEQRYTTASRELHVDEWDYD
jgi:hypothetical protein